MSLISKENIRNDFGREISLRRSTARGVVNIYVHFKLSHPPYIVFNHPDVKTDVEKKNYFFLFNIVTMIWGNGRWKYIYTVSVCSVYCTWG